MAHTLGKRKYGIRKYRPVLYDIRRGKSLKNVVLDYFIQHEYIGVENVQDQIKTLLGKCIPRAWNDHLSPSVIINRASVDLQG